MTSQELYINTIDECIDNIFDTLHLYIEQHNEIKKILKNLDIVIDNFLLIKARFDNIINTSIEQYKLKEIITNDKDYDYILNLIYDYIYLYSLLYLASLFNLNDIILFMNKLKAEHPYNFFKNKYITQYSIYYKYVKDYEYVIENYDTVLSDKKLLIQYDDVMVSLKSLDNELIESLKTLEYNYRLHTILKIVIFKEIYIDEDKFTIFKIVEKNEYSNAEYKYIDIVDTKYETIDYSSIERLFTSKEINQGIAEDVYNMINEYEISRNIQDYNIDIKINHLFKQKLLIPITDDFLRFHKDSEMYDKSSDSKIDPKEKTNKKDNTKIRYIVTKFNRIKDFYSPKIQSDQSIKSEIEKYFYQPLLYRKAVIINDLEEINILRKLELQGTNVINNNEYYDGLKYYREYPYIDFKYSKRNSFSFLPSQTYSAIRYCNFEYKHDPKFSNVMDKSLIQYRVINNTTKCNIIGVAIPTNKNNQLILQSQYVRNTMNMELLNSNGFLVTIKKLRKLFVNNKKYSKMLYWLFDKNKDKIKLNLFDNIKELPTEDYIKLLLGKVYDEIVDITYNIIYTKIGSFDKITIQQGKTILKELEKNSVLIPRTSEKYSELQKLIYFIKSRVNMITKDDNINKIFDINREMIKLPKITLDKSDIHVIKIKKKDIIDDKTDEDMYDGLICGHILSWNNLLKYKKSDPNKFNQGLTDFINKYVLINKDQDFVCKSCYQMVDINKYTSDIYPGSDTIILSYGLDTDLETISEYVKYSRSIKNIDKYIENIAYTSNITYYVGASQQPKFRRQDVIKTVIDLIDIQYKTLYSKDTNIRKERLDKSVKKYGCSLTNFFLFKLENDIFTYSSKEVDKFKLFKLNNIYIYIMMIIIIELNLSQILFLSFDKLVNYFLFTKFGYNLFENLYIRVSNKNDLAPIKNYKMLCYVIYYLSGIYAKKDMWFAENITFKPNSINPQIQRFIIHTFVDALNSILEVNSRDSKSYIYNVFSTKFFNKLNTVYDNKISKDVIDKLEMQNKKKVIITDDKKLKYKFNIVEAIPLKLYMSDGQYILKSSIGIQQKIASYPSVYFEKNRLIKTVPKIDIKDITKILDEQIEKTASLYDLKGVKRNISLSSDEIKKMSMDEIKKIYEKVREVRIKEMKNTDKNRLITIEKFNVQFIKNQKYVDEMKKTYMNDMSDTIDKFIDKIESLIGTNININNSNYYLKENVYIINHNYHGKKIEPIIIKESEDKIKFRQNDSYFKQDVYYYYDKLNQVTLYYSYIEKYVIGYKENSNVHTRVYNSDCYIIINYSITNQLKLFGFNYVNYKIPNKIKSFNINDFVNNILRNRLQNLKNSLSIFQQIIYQIKNKYSGSNLNPIAKYYQSKIKSINTFDNKGERIFSEWSIINNNLYFDRFDISSNIHKIELPNKTSYISTEILLRFLTNDHIILNYIIEQFNILIDINTDNYTKVNLVYLILNMIIQQFKKLNDLEKASFDIAVKQFYDSILNRIEVFDVIEDVVDFSNMTEEEIEQYKDEEYNERERLNALDADQDEINEDFGDEEVLIHSNRLTGEY